MFTNTVLLTHAPFRSLTFLLSVGIELTENQCQSVRSRGVAAESLEIYIDLRHRSAQTGLKSLKKTKIIKKESKNNQLKNSNPRQTQQQNSKQAQKQLQKLKK